MQVIEKLKTDRFTYTLYSVGKSFKTEVVEHERILKSGKVIKENVITRTHRTLQAALGSNLRPSQEMFEIYQ